MLTAAEEEGLAGLALASRVQHALYRLAPGDLAELIEDLRVGALNHHVVYLHEGEVEPIRILPAPLTVLPEQLAYVHRITLAVQGALERLPSLYLHDFTVREILRLPDAEEAWLRDCWGPSQEAHNPVFGRLDALVDFTSPMWKDTLRFVEPNMTGIGGLHMVPVCERLLADIVVPVLRDGDAGLDLTVGQDMRELLVRMLLKHAAAIGAGPHLCFVEPKYAGNGPDEQGELARWMRDRYGLTVMHDFLPVTVGAAMGIHKDVFDKVDGWDVESTPLLDIDLSWRLQLAGFAIAFCPGAVLRYRYRTGLRATYRQKRNYAIGDVFVMKRFAPMGAPRRTPIETARGWWHLVLSGVKVRDRRSAMLFVDRLGSAVGRIQGSIRCRYLSL